MNIFRRRKVVSSFRFDRRTIKGATEEASASGKSRVLVKKNSSKRNVLLLAFLCITLYFFLFFFNILTTPLLTPTHLLSGQIDKGNEHAKWSPQEQLDSRQQNKNKIRMNRRIPVEGLNTKQVPISIRETWKKEIQPGNHANIPDPSSRIGPNGEVGYVHDPEFITKRSPQSLPLILQKTDITCAKPGEGHEGADGYIALQNIRTHMEQKAHHEKIKDGVKLFCAVYTYAPGGNLFTQAIQETWGKRCDGFLFASSESNQTTGHTHLPTNSPHGFGYKGMAQRTRAILSYLYDNFLDDYDYFHLCGDDTYLIVENLKAFLKSTQKWEAQAGLDRSVPIAENYLFAGFQFSWGRKKSSTTHYLGGGSGYSLSAKALKAFVEGPLQTCNPQVENPNEDMYVSNCFDEYLMDSKNWIDTRDYDGAHRYHQLSVDRTSTFGEKGKHDFMEKVIIESMKGYAIRNGPPGAVFRQAAISNSSIAFHKHLDPNYLRRYELLLYGSSELMECN
jgi:hypothetical protein